MDLLHLSMWRLSNACWTLVKADFHTCSIMTKGQSRKKLDRNEGRALGLTCYEEQSSGKVAWKGTYKKARKPRMACDHWGHRVQILESQEHFSEGNLCLYFKVSLYLFKSQCDMYMLWYRYWYRYRYRCRYANIHVSEVQGLYPSSADSMVVHTSRKLDWKQ